MNQSKRTGRVVALLLGIGLLAAPVSTTWAHTRIHDHRHRAVIVVGKPRPAGNVVVVNGVAHGTLDLNVKPRATEVWVDGVFRGTCGQLDGVPGKLHLRPGVHRVRLVTPDGASVARDVRVRAGVEINVGLDLR